MYGSKKRDMDGQNERRLKQTAEGLTSKKNSGWTFSVVSPLESGCKVNCLLKQQCYLQLVSLAHCKIEHCLVSAA